MPLTPESTALLASFAASAAAPPAPGVPLLERLRAGASRAPALMQPAEEVHLVREELIPGPTVDPVRIRLYRASERSDLPIIVYLHGGGFATSDIDAVDPISRTLANRTGALVVAVDYRKSPEHPFPAGLEDAYASLLWVAEHAAQLGGDPERLVVVGDSSGANFAAVISRWSTERGGPHIALQVLVNPVMDTDLDTYSWREFGDGSYLLSRDLMAAYFEMYLGGADPHHPDVAPLKAASVQGLPPAFIAVPEYDPLRHGAEEYARRLKAAQVPVELTTYPGLMHGFWWMGAKVPQSSDLFDDIAVAVERHCTAPLPDLADTSTRPTLPMKESNA